MVAQLLIFTFCDGGTFLRTWLTTGTGKQMENNAMKNGLNIYHHCSIMRNPIVIDDLM